MVVDIVKAVALLVVVLGGLTLVVVFIRNSRAKGFPAAESTSHFAQMKGAMPPNPKPVYEKGEFPDDYDRTERN